MHQGRRERVRLHGIDAPEKGQPFTNRAKQFVSDFCYHKKVKVETKGHHELGRISVWSNYEGVTGTFDPEDLLSLLKKLPDRSVVKRHKERPNTALYFGQGRLSPEMQRSHRSSEPRPTVIFTTDDHD